MICLSWRVPERCSDNQGQRLDWPGTALGLMLALSGLDTLILRPLMTRLARRYTVRTVMRVPTVLALLLAAPLLMLALLRR